MTIVTQMTDAKSEAEIRRIRDKYMNILPDSQKCRLEELARRNINRLKREMK
jgi:hypothetical protein